MFRLWTICAWLLQASAAFAITDGKDIILPNSPDQKLMRQITVKIYTVIDGRPSSCTGAMIGVGDVLSAGHCAIEFKQALKKGQVFVEAYDENSPTKKRILQVASADAKYDGVAGKKANVDLAVFHVSGKLPFQVSVPMAYKNCDPIPAPMVAGYGLNQYTQPSGFLKQTTYVRQPDNRSRIAKLWGDKMVDFQANADGRVCYGDSGAPIFCKVNGRLAIAGVLSGFPMGTTAWAPSKTAADCLVSDKMTATSVSESMNQIESWRTPVNHEELIVDTDPEFTSSVAH